jgi:hypothetical protein
MKKDSQTLVLILFALAFYTTTVFIISTDPKDLPALVISGMLCMLFAGLSVYQVIKN